MKHPLAKAAIIAATLFIFEPIPSLASSWQNLREFTYKGLQYTLYLNRASFRRHGNFASAVVEVTGTDDSGRKVDSETYQYIADCSKWIYKKGGQGRWLNTPRESPADDVNTYLCSNERLAKPSDSGDNSSNVNIKIEPPSTTERIKGKIINHLLDQMLFGY